MALPPGCARRIVGAVPLRARGPVPHADVTFWPMPRRPTFHLIPHTHWDREWYRSRAAFRARLVSAFGAMLDLLHRDPHGRFTLDGQTVILDDVLDVAPEWELAIAQLVHQRRLAIGPWYILADEQLPCGESLLRNLLEGSRDAALWGNRMDVLYSPDAFGHPAILPALAAEFGIGAGVVWRGLAPAPGAERDLYRWRAPDGREIVVHHLPRAGYESGAALLEPRRLAQRWATLRGQLLARAVTPEIAVWIGADHRAPPPALHRLCATVAAAGIASSCPSQHRCGIHGGGRTVPRGDARRGRSAPVVRRIHLEPARRARHPSPAQAPPYCRRVAAVAPRRSAGGARRRSTAHGHPVRCSAPRAAASSRASSTTPSAAASPTRWRASRQYGSTACARRRRMWPWWLSIA